VFSFFCALTHQLFARWIISFSHIEKLLALFPGPYPSRTVLVLQYRPTQLSPRSHHPGRALAPYLFGRRNAFFFFFFCFRAKAPPRTLIPPDVPPSLHQLVRSLMDSSEAVRIIVSEAYRPFSPPRSGTIFTLKQRLLNLHTRRIHFSART